MKLSILLVSLAVLAAGCIQAPYGSGPATPVPDATSAPAETPTITPAPAQTEPTPAATPAQTASPIASPSPTPTLSPIREFKLAAKNWDFTPNTLEVVKGDRVKITITSLDDGAGSGHGFALPDFGINKAFKKGETVEVEFVADKAGEFRFFCSVFCGSGHGTMAGKLVVK